MTARLHMSRRHTTVSVNDSHQALQERAVCPYELQTHNNFSVNGKR